MNEGGSLYIGAFGTKIREKKTVSLINAKSSEIFNKTRLKICQNSRFRENYDQKVDHHRGKNLDAMAHASLK